MLSLLYSGFFTVEFCLGPLCSEGQDAYRTNAGSGYRLAATRGQLWSVQGQGIHLRALCPGEFPFL